jgi:integrase
MKLRRVLTDFAVTKAKPKPEGYEISDGGQRGLRLAIQPTGVKSWIVRYRHPVSGVSRKLTLQPGLSLAHARKIAAEAMFMVAQGIDPINAKREAKQAALASVEGTLHAVAKQYLDLAASKLRSHDAYERILKNHVLPRLGERQVANLRRSEIVAALDKVEHDSGPRAADMALAVLRSTLSWHEKRSDGFRSPIIKGMARLKASERVRDRVLSDDEVRAVWRAAGDERIGLYGQVIRFMILTGSRRAEAVGLRRTEIETVRDNGADITVWRLPASRSKNKREVVRPLSAAALSLIKATPMIGEEGDLVFSFNGARPMSMNHGDKKDLMDQLAGVTNWRLHDLRRVHRSLLSRCRVPFEVAERLLGHAQPLIARTYDRHSHLPAMLEAVEKVAAEVERIVEGEGSGQVIRPRVFHRDV